MAITTPERTVAKMRESVIVVTESFDEKMRKELVPRTFP